MLSEKYVEKCLSFSLQQKLFSTGDRVLLAVSGGLDSMCMLHLMHQMPVRVEIAHCNFQLRGSESDEDQNFVYEMAKSLGLDCHTKVFACEDYARKQGISIQMAARQLRYRWFEQLALGSPFNAIATAHHIDDSIETFFNNLMRGTGIKGLTGIPVSRGIFIRPMMCFTRGEIEEIVNSGNITFREDSSNQSVKYMRNKIRHEILPLIEKIHPGFTATMAQNLTLLQKENQVLESILDSEIHRHSSGDPDQTILPLPAGVTNPIYTLAFERHLLSKGFTSDQISKLTNEPPPLSGSKFLSPEYQLRVDRERILLSSAEKYPIFQAISIDAAVGDLSFPQGKLSWSVHEGHMLPSQPSEGEEYLDLEKVSFPMLLRVWEAGDRIQPLGMVGEQKLQDLYTNLKVPAHEKEKSLVLLSAEGDILWAIPYRISEKVKVTINTRKMLKLAWKSFSD